MELGELRAICRGPEVLDDEVAPFLWDDPSVNRWINNAVREACIRGRLLKGDADTTPSLCSIPVTTPIADYQLQPEINGVRSAILYDDTAKLILITSAGMDKIEPRWDSGTATASNPKYLVMDTAQNSVRLYPPPVANTTLRLRVWRSPLDVELMEDDYDEPCVNLLAPEELKHWVGYEAFGSKDSEMKDEERAAAHLALFVAMFGPRPSQHAMSRWADSPRTRPMPDYF